MLIVTLDTVDSTQRIAKEYAAQGAPHGTAIIAREQSQGRGRLGRQWHGVTHAVLMSVVLRPHCPARLAHRLTLAAAVGLFDALSPRAPTLQIKWPNDLVFMQDGHLKKLGGVLVEAVAWQAGELTAAVLGVGVNIAADDVPEALSAIVGTLEMLGEGNVDRVQLAVALRDAALARTTASLADFTATRDTLVRASATLGKDVTVSDGSTVMRGHADALDDEGALVLRTATGLRTVHAGDVWPA